LVEQRPRTAYWDGELIDFDWDANGAIWEFLWTAAQRAKANKPVCEDDLVSPARQGKKTLVHRRSRLSKAVPPMLDALIETVRPRGYRLVLGADEVALLSPGSEEQPIDVGLDVAGRQR
jgi:hypothetical protein